MNRILNNSGRFLVFLVAAVLAAGPALADKPEGKGKGHGKGHSKGDERTESVERRVYFNDQHRGYVREYYHEEYRRGFCPPGLAKKNNGCMPPGQAKKWQVGRPLPREVIYYDLPPRVVVQLGTPPAGHRYVRVAADILLIAIGTGMVIDAIQDLSGM
jgi:Ni/Co efflux regulator RcnB